MSNHQRTHRRLIAATGVSTVFVIALFEILARLFGNFACLDAWCVDKPRSLTVRLVNTQVQRLSEISIPDYEIRKIPEVPSRATDVGTIGSAPLKIDEESVEKRMSKTDLYAIAKESVARSVEDRLAQEEIRDSMWRSTWSVMFEDGDEFEIHEPVTIIADREFRVPLGVLGIGITIGGCFFGIPLAGIPVEERTVGPNVIYCRDIYE